MPSPRLFCEPLRPFWLYLTMKSTFLRTQNVIFTVSISKRDISVAGGWVRQYPVLDSGAAWHMLQTWCLIVKRVSWVSVHYILTVRCANFTSFEALNHKSPRKSFLSNSQCWMPAKVARGKKDYYVWTHTRWQSILNLDEVKKVFPGLRNLS